MGKGFGVKPEVQLGYVLLVLPDANAYAAKLDLDIGQVHIENPLMAIVLGLFRFVCFLFNLLTFQKFHRPNADALANMNESNKEEFIGLTSLLEDAQVWKSIKEAKQAIAY